MTTRTLPSKVLILALWCLFFPYNKATGGVALQSTYTKLFKDMKDGSFNRSGAEGCKRGTFYASFKPECQKEVLAAYDEMNAEKDAATLLKLAEAIRDRPKMHPRVWFAAFSMVAMQREDLRALHKPFPTAVLPDTFFNPAAATGYTEEEEDKSLGIITLRAGKVSEAAKCIGEKLGQDNGAENALWYFREDYQLNAHHLLWHMTYPAGLRTHPDRRGELFYYMHHSMLARYKTERLVNGIAPLEHFQLKADYVMKEGYNPHLNDANSGSRWATREKNTVFPKEVLLSSDTDVLWTNGTIRSYQRLNDAVGKGFFVNPEDRQVSLNTFDGIDQVVCTAESTQFGVNDAFYGDLHNDGHNIIANSHQPMDIRDTNQVMYDTATSMRDPVFYQWHEMLDDLFIKHKNTLPAYLLRSGNFSMKWDAIKVQKLTVTSTNKARPANEIGTSWGDANIALERGIDINRADGSKPIKVCVKQLAHEEFTYSLTINGIARRLKEPVKATIRIYMAPRYGANGQRMSLEEQRQLFFIMDTFTVTVKAGANQITRSSRDNALTLPFSKTTDINDNTPYCGCGWPHHLYVPKGTVAGMAFDLFAIVTQEELLDTTSECKTPYLICGVPGKNYPETKPMGWPFDRKMAGTSQKDVFSNLDALVKALPNSIATQVVIKHQDTVKVL